MSKKLYYPTFEPLCPKTFQAIISPQKSCVPATYFERRFLKTWVFNLTLSGKLSFLCTQEKMFQCANQIQPRVKSTPVGDICEAHAIYRDDILVCGERERERLESCKFVKANAAASSQRQKKVSRKVCQKHSSSSFLQWPGNTVFSDQPLPLATQ